ncbi:hypothetical protein SAMN05444050_6704 [Afipia sp. GAS231]|nr:hypothetical protein SAMN05444050_6704 [Afipia sp. GAS231]
MALDGYDPIASGLPRIAVRGRPFLSEHTDNNRFCYYKDGLSLAKPIILASTEMMGFAALNPSL